MIRSHPSPILFGAALLIAAGASPHIHAAAISAGITGIAPRHVVRHRAPEAPADKIWLYQLALPFQVSATKAGVFVNVREGLAQGVDFEAGNDILIFGSLDEIPTAKPIVTSRNEILPNPNTVPPGKPSTMVKFPVRGGFVPHGAKRADGTPHPHAGTGFGFSIMQAWQTIVPGPPPYRQLSYQGAESYLVWDLQQYSYDGQTFRVKSEHIPIGDILPGWSIPNGGVTNAIPDGDDMLIAMLGKEIVKPGGDPNSRRIGAGVMRMRRDAGKWRAVSIDIVPGTQYLSEPSVIRDIDGRLLFSGRGGRTDQRTNDVQVWRSDKNDRNWEKIIDVKDIIVTPVSLNQAADGTPYLAAGLNNITPGPNDPLTIAAKKAGTPVAVGKGSRSTLCIWPLNADRNGLEKPIVVKDCRAEFGPPPGNSNWTWRADHPSGMALRLADGKWHTLLGVRVQDYREIKEAMPPTPQTGMYVHEILTRGQPRPVWKF